MWGRGIRISIAGVTVAAASFAGLVVIAPPAGATVVNDETTLRAAFGDVNETTIVLGADISLSDCGTGAVDRNSGVAVQLDGGGHSITQTCADKQVLFQEGSGAVTLTNVTISGGSVGIQSEGPVTIDGSTITGQTSTTHAFGAQVVDNALTVTHSTITNQTQTGAGSPSQLGAAGLDASGNVTVTNSTVSGQSGGGSIVAGISGDPFVTVTGSTVSGQSESGSGGVAGIFGRGVTVTGSTITGINGGTDGIASGVRTDFSAVLSSTTVTAIHGSSATGVSGVLVTTNGVTVSDVAGHGASGFADGIATQSSRGGHLSATDTLVSGVSGTTGASGVDGIVATVTLNRSTVTGVTANENAIGVRADLELMVTNSTITANNGIGVSFTIAGAVIAYSDIVGNRGVPAQIVSQGLGGLTIFGSVVTNASGSTNCSVNAITSAGYNFADNTSCHLTATGDTQANSANPQLGPLANNGGPTPTLLPASTSPLLEKIPLAACQTAPATGVTTDQRLLPRPRGLGCDIGSVEIQIPTPLVIQPNFTG